MMASDGTLTASGDTYRPSAFKTAEHNALQEHKVRRLFEQGLPCPAGQQRTEFDEVFGEDPLDFLMTEFALPIYEAETNRSLIEARGQPEKKIIPLPEALSFQEMETALQRQWTERTCPEEHYFKKFLNESVKEALTYALDEADQLGIVDDHRVFKLFCPLDYIAQHLWTNNKRYPERRGMAQARIPMFTEYFKHFPREEPPLHLTLTTNQAAIVIQKRWKGTMTRRRPDIKALRRHIAAARVQYCDPRKLVEELWERPIQLRKPKGKTSSANGEKKPSYSPPKMDVAEQIPPLPKFLQTAKREAEIRLKALKMADMKNPPEVRQVEPSDSEEEVEKPPIPLERTPPVAPSALPENPSGNPADGTATVGTEGVANPRKSNNQSATGQTALGEPVGNAGAISAASVSEPKGGKEKSVTGGDKKKKGKDAK